MLAAQTWLSNLGSASVSERMLRPETRSLRCFLRSLDPNRVDFAVRREYRVASGEADEAPADIRVGAALSGLAVVTESVIALTVTFVVSRYRKLCNFGC